MKKISFSLAIVFCCISFSFAQVDTLRGEAARELLMKINKALKIDTAAILNKAGADACKCIDSIGLYGKSTKEINADIFTCINKQVGSYQLLMKIYRSMAGIDSNYVLNLDKNSNEYQHYYFEMERWLTDSCPSIKKAAASDNKEAKNSTSSDKVAIDLYNRGIKEMDKENFSAALTLFEKAVKQDEVFAFAWDNIGICKRKLGDLDGALEAYLKSLTLDPSGRLPLQNIPVVYEYKKDYDKALEAYKNLSKIYPDDPEAYYGSGRMYEMKNDYEKALDYMCKAYNAYIAINSPYRSDAEKNISIYFKKLKDAGKEAQFYQILKDNHIKTN